MVGNQHYSRINTMELKNMMFQKIGQQRGERYFHLLRKLFSLKISKVEFDKVCIRTIGKDNVFLHNRLIRSIMMNANMSSTPPEIRNSSSCLSVKVDSGTGSQKSCLLSSCGDTLAQSPRRNRTPIHRNRKCTNRPSPLGPFGTSPTTGTATGKSPSIITEEPGVVMMRPPVQMLSVESGEEVEQHAVNSPSVQSKVPVTAPLGVSINDGSTRKSLWNQHVDEQHHSFVGPNGYLPDTQTLRDRLAKRLAGEGIGVSMEAAELINRSLDVHLKRLLGSGLKIAGSHGGGGIGISWNIQNISRMNVPTPLFYPQGSASANVTDFRVAMEANPRILGTEWPLQLEKICFRTS